MHVFHEVVYSANHRVPGSWWAPWHGQMLGLASRSDGSVLVWPAVANLPEEEVIPAAKVSFKAIERAASRAIKVVRA